MRDICLACKYRSYLSLLKMAIVSPWLYRIFFMPLFHELWIQEDNIFPLIFPFLCSVAKQAIGYIN